LRRRGVKIIWLSYLDSSRTRSQGRRLPKRSAIVSPKLSEVVSACESLKFQPEAYADKSYCRSWWEKDGYVMVRSDAPKTEILSRVADMIERTRREGRRAKR